MPGSPPPYTRRERTRRKESAITSQAISTTETTHTTSAPSGTKAGGRPGSFRPEVQALRALAVALVVTYHLWPGALPGGYVGVDVFFVISGFLITGQLIREIDSSGSIRLVRFWSRRVRRLLPAAFLVLVAVAVGVWAFVPEALWQQFFREIGASALYVQNWALVQDAVNYFAAGNLASPVQHFWSLSVEEQFYLVWPLLLLLPLLIRARSRVQRTVTLAVLGAGSAVSLAYGISLSATDPSVAYLSTFTRAWEFGVGGLLAFVIAGLRMRPAVCAVLSWAGLAAIGVSAFVINGDTPFPGTAALLPVAGTIAVIAAGLPDARWAPSGLMMGRFVQWLGGASYSLYLWHWPLIVIVPLALARFIPGYHEAGAVTLVAILFASLACAGLSKRYVEDRTRTAPVLAGARPRRSIFVMAGAMAVIVAVCGVAWNGVQHTIATSQVKTAALVSAMPACLGASAIDPATPQPCENDDLHGVLAPSPVSVADDLPDTCITGTRAVKPVVCEGGVSAEAATKTVALVGDSHAAQWEPALETVAQEKGWHIVMMLKGSCAFSKATRAGDPASAAVTSCAKWNSLVRDKLAAMPSVSALITSADIKDLYADKAGRSGYQNAVAGYRSTWKALPASISTVYVIADTPRPAADAQTCLEVREPAQRLEPGACAQSRADAIGDDPLVAAASGASSRVKLIDMTDDFCTQDSCDPVVGHVLVYRDKSHMTATYAATLAPYLKRALAAQA
ncbi:acyltransferase family protein [Microbacterium sp. STN6]|uniref:acyltransferase family protein n=1 Tax=Microbacterium sp. STN6 TaxID=2995588 RepID=UPI002260BEF6|nr:acyltransferase family protein [Microbacterium sp. STN6]MCX7521664.1 acyltransferase family protein [Microbacterium sp. STN6]